MKNILKSWKTTVVAIIALAGLAYNGYTNGGFSVQDFVFLFTAIGFLVAKDADKSHSLRSFSKDRFDPPNSDHEEK